MWDSKNLGLMIIFVLSIHYIVAAMIELSWEVGNPLGTVAWDNPEGLADGIPTFANFTVRSLAIISYQMHPLCQNICNEFFHRKAANIPSISMHDFSHPTPTCIHLYLKMSHSKEWNWTCITPPMTEPQTTKPTHWGYAVPIVSFHLEATMMTSPSLTLMRARMRLLYMVGQR